VRVDRGEARPRDLVLGDGQGGLLARAGQASEAEDGEGLPPAEYAPNGRDAVELRGLRVRPVGHLAHTYAVTADGWYGLGVDGAPESSARPRRARSGL